MRKVLSITGLVTVLGIGSVQACTNGVTFINPTVGGTVHVTFVDENCSPLQPGGFTLQGTPNPSGFLTITADSTGYNFKGLTPGQFVFTITDPVGSPPFPSMTLTVTVGTIPTSISAVSP